MLNIAVPPSYKFLNAKECETEEPTVYIWVVGHVTTPVHNRLNGSL